MASGTPLVRQDRIVFSRTWQGRYFNLLGYVLSVYCVYKIVMVRSDTPPTLIPIHMHVPVRLYACVPVPVCLCACACAPMCRGACVPLPVPVHLCACMPVHTLTYTPAPWLAPFRVPVSVGARWAQAIVNIVLDRHGKTDPVTQGFALLARYVGLQLDVRVWSQHVSFMLVGVIVVTNIRGLLLQLMRVRPRGELSPLPPSQRHSVCACARRTPTPTCTDAAARAY
jgi:hypothetical protein